MGHQEKINIYQPHDTPLAYSKNKEAEALARIYDWKEPQIMVLLSNYISTSYSQDRS